MRFEMKSKKRMSLSLSPCFLVLHLCQSPIVGTFLHCFFREVIDSSETNLGNHCSVRSAQMSVIEISAVCICFLSISRCLFGTLHGLQIWFPDVEAVVTKVV